MTQETIHLSLEATGQRLDAVLAAHFADVSRAQIQNWIRSGCIADENGKILDTPSFKAKAPLGIVVTRVHKKPFAPPAAEAKPDNLVIVYEDDHLLVINKPAGIAVHPGAGRSDGTLVNMLLGHTNGTLSSMTTHERPGIVHRLDKDTSGLMIVAKTNAAHAKLVEALQRHDIVRIYHAIVWSIPSPPTGTIATQLGRDHKNRQAMAVLPDTVQRGKHAVTHYETIRQFGLDFTLVACRLETGRTHQIRVHMNHIGCPVLGDPIYGGRTPRQAKRQSAYVQQMIANLPGQMLHAQEISFVHPVTSEDMHFTAEPPEIFQSVAAALGGR